MIHEVLPNGSAAQDGRLRAGDVILRANGHDLRSCSHHEAIMILRLTPSVIQLLVFRDSEVTQDHDSLEVILTQLHRKTGKGLGLCLASDAGSGVFVSQVLKGSLADCAGRVTEGDRILEVNGRDLKSCSHEEATSILKVCDSSLSSESPHVNRLLMLLPFSFLNPCPQSSLRNPTRLPVP